MNIFDDALRSIIKNEAARASILEIGDTSHHFKCLGKFYKAIGSKIDWSRIPRAIERSEPNQRRQHDSCVKFFDEVRATYALQGDICYAGDGPSSIGLTANIEALRRILPRIVDLPQHHYFFATDYSWCMSFTMEGDMAFGFAYAAQRPPPTVPG